MLQGKLIHVTSARFGVLDSAQPCMTYEDENMNEQNVLLCFHSDNIQLSVAVLGHTGHTCPTERSSVIIISNHENLFGHLVEVRSITDLVM